MENETLIVSEKNWEKGRDLPIYLDKRLFIKTLPYYRNVVASEGVKPKGVEVILT